MNVNIGKIASVAGAVLGIAGTLISNYASKKQQDETIATKVAEALANQTKES